MLTIAEVTSTLQTVLGPVADDAARTTGLVQRRSKLTGAAFVQALVFGWLADPAASREALAQTAALGGIRVSAQAIDQRLSLAAAACLRTVLAAAARALLAADPVAIPLLARFTGGVVVQDSTSIGLPGGLATIWPGCGNATTPAKRSATLKLQLRLDLQTGHLDGPVLQAGRRHDHPDIAGLAPLPPAALWLGDLGFFDLRAFAAWHAAGCAWLVRLKAGTVLRDPDGTRLDLARLLAAHADGVLDRPIVLGAGEAIPARLLAVRVPADVAAARRRRLHAEARRRGQPVSRARLALVDWTLLVTNLPPDRLSVAEALVLYRARWQIELLFKLWKRDALLDEWRSAKPAAILCELYAKLLACLVQHWALVLACWAAPDRSLPKAAQTVRKLAALLASSLRDTIRLVAALRLLTHCLAADCRIAKRRATPATFQTLLAGGPDP